MKKVHIRMFPLLVKGLGDGNSECFLLEECLEDDGLFSDLVNQVAAKYPALGETILDPKSQQLQQGIVVFLNGRVLCLPAEWGTKLENGDSLYFLTAFAGG